jgi:hypothetical protein
MQWCITLTLVLLTGVWAEAQYTYKTINVPFIGAMNTRINGLTDLGTMSGTHDDANGFSAQLAL